jgi:predicted metalloprotease with PDZ domain
LRPNSRTRFLLFIGTIWLPGHATAAPADYANPDRMYAALAEQPHETMSVGGATIDVVFADGAPGLDRARTMRWVRGSAASVATYFGSFPVKHLGLLIIAGEGARVGGGTTYGYAGSAIRIRVGRDADEAAFRRDWVLVHEMTHLALPVVPRRSMWLLEGSATYIEPIARVQAGQLDAATIWRDMKRDMPQGLPADGDRGLDNTPTWGRTYWGGALFLLQADVAIRQQTDNRKGLQDALRAINRASGGNATRWSIDQITAVGDAATGTDVLRSFYARMKDSPAPVDLDDLFARLGVVERDGRIVFDDNAPLATIRRAITATPPQSAFSKSG